MVEIEPPDLDTISGPNGLICLEIHQHGADCDVGRTVSELRPRSPPLHSVKPDGARTLTPPSASVVVEDLRVNTISLYRRLAHMSSMPRRSVHHEARSWRKR